jgi:predicted transcriptional regulator
MIIKVTKCETTNKGNDKIDNSKKMLLTYIDKTPGIRYKELSRLTGLNNGVLSYHLSVLEKLYWIKVDRQNSRITRYYTVNIPSEESNIIGQLRNSVVRQIMMFILEHDLCTFNEIVEYIKKAPSTVSWYLKRLKDTGLILIIHGEEYQLYTVPDRESMLQILHKYKESFVDKVVDNYTDMVETL